MTLAKNGDGNAQMTVRLQPAELGMVQIRIARVVSGATQIEITAEDPKTLLALQQDQPQLHRTLDDAGIPAAGRAVTFHAASTTPLPGAITAPASSAGHASSGQGFSNRAHTGSADPDGSTTGGGNGYAARERNGYAAGKRSSAPPSAAPSPASVTHAYRIGLDITA